MADSDDEYDRKRRDKFRGERSAGGGESYRSERRGEERRREDWPERNPFRGGRSRPDYREYRGAGRDRYSPGRDLPQAKRMRPDWGDDGRPRYAHDGYGMYGWGHEHYPMHGHGFGGPPMTSHSRGGGANDASNSDLQTQPPMLTLKQFLDTQDDGISDADVLRKYSEYKVEFKREQLNEFFVAHKDEEWFKNKYHPEESLKRKDEQLSFLHRRVEVFSELLEQGSITSVTVDTNQSEPLLRLLDTVVIKLEGGTEEDLKALDEKVPDVLDINIKSRINNDKKNDDDDVIITDIKIENSKKYDNDGNNDDSLRRAPPVEVSTAPKIDDDDDWDDSDNDDNKSDGKDKLPAKKNDTKRKRSHSESSTSSSSSSDESRKDSIENGNDNNGKIKIKEEKIDEENKTNNKDDVDDVDDDDGDVNCRKKSLEKSENNSSNATNNDVSIEENKDKSIDSNTTIEEINKDNEEGKNIEKTNDDDGNPKKGVDEKNENENGNNNNEKTEETIDVDKVKDIESSILPERITGPRALHRTSSIFLRNLAPTITKAEIEAVCKRYDGFLRVAIADPLVERRWFRRGWVTLKRDVNIKEICWNLNNIRLRDCEMGAIVNRDLSRRVRPVNGITAHKAIVRNDIKLCAKIVLNLDEKFSLWLNKILNDNSANESFGFKSNNPVLHNITDYLIEEASAEEDELLGLTNDNKDSIDGEMLERETQLISVLDKLILYLRIVHSVDFYNHCEYPYEDEMPNRCGIIHARGPPPQNKITNNDVQEYSKNFDGKMSSFLAKSTSIEEDELKNLGCKDPEAEVEKFVQANTQEISKDKWLCPLSGKKFKGPEFIRKHIFNKHAEKVDEVRKEVDYFNNYLKDPKRPQLPEHPGNVKRQPITDMGPHIPYRGYPMGGYIPPYAAYAPPMIAPPRSRGFGGGRRGPGGDFRPIIHYRDLDAPREPVDLL